MRLLLDTRNSASSFLARRSCDAAEGLLVKDSGVKCTRLPPARTTVPGVRARRSSQHEQRQQHRRRQTPSARRGPPAPFLSHVPTRDRSGADHILGHQPLAEPPLEASRDVSRPFSQGEANLLSEGLLAGTDVLREEQERRVRDEGAHSSGRFLPHASWTRLEDATASGPAALPSLFQTQDGPAVLLPEVAREVLSAHELGSTLAEPSQQALGEGLSVAPQGAPQGLWPQKRLRQLVRSLPWARGSRADVGDLVVKPMRAPVKETTSTPFRLQLSCPQSTVLLNVLAFGYAATAVVVKAMSGHSSEAASAAAEVAAGGALIPGGWMSVSTSMEFAVRFSAAALASTLLLWAANRKGAAEQDRVTAGVAQDDSSAAGGEGKKKTSLWWAGLDLGFWMFVTYSGQAVGLQTTSAHDAALILTASVVLVPFLEALAGSRLHWSVWGATLFACFGLILLEGGAAEAATEAAGSLGAILPPLEMYGAAQIVPSGHMWCFLSAVGSAVHVVRSEEQCTEHSPLELVTLQLGTTAALGLLWVGATAGNAAALNLGMGADCSALSCLGNAWAGLPMGMVLLSGPLGTGLCEWLELEALQYVKASTATLILTSSPLWASLLAFVSLGETMSMSTMAGAALILMSSLQVQLLCPCKEDEH